jgi:carboxyl-terminal processing protease
VQEQYDLADGAALRLTIARYYTPLGRNIQKPYNKGRSAYNDELAERFHNGEMLTDTAALNHHTGPAFKTKHGRIVYGGGGITPDIFVPFDTGTFSDPVYALFNKQTFSKFIYTYYIQHRTYFDKFKDPTDFIQHFNQTEDAWNNLVNYAAKDSIQLQSIAARDKAEIEQRIKSWMARQLWRMPGYFEVTNATDNAVKKALEEIEKK